MISPIRKDNVIQQPLVPKQPILRLLQPCILLLLLLLLSCFIHSRSVTIPIVSHHLVPDLQTIPDKSSPFALPNRVISSGEKAMWRRSRVTRVLLSSGNGHTQTDAYQLMV